MPARPRHLTLPAIGLALAVSNAFADSAANPPAARKLPAASAPPACVCTHTNEGGFIVANCQCGNLQCVSTISGNGNGATSTACVK